MSEITTTAEPSAPVAPSKVSIKETVLAQFKDAEATITTLATKYKDVAYAVATPSGMREALAARADLRDNGRLFVTRAENSIKGEVNDLKRVMASEVERLVAIVKPVEDAVDLQIKAEEKRKADEKEKREKLETERTDKHRENIDKIKGYVARATGQPIEVIERGVAVVSAMEFGPEWEEFAAEATSARDAAVAGLNKLISEERMRLENERLQKELADARALLAAAAPVQKVEAPSQDFVDLLPDAAAELAAAKASEGAELSPAAQALYEAEGAANFAKAHPKVTHGDVVRVMMPATVRQAMAPKADTPPTLTLGEISTRLGFNVTSAFLATLGFEATTVKAAKLFHSDDFTAICEAIKTHISEVQDQFEPATA